METKSVGIREFRAGLAEFIDNKQPVAVTRHGQTVGLFVPLRRPSVEDVQRVQAAAANVRKLMPLSEDQVEEMVADFNAWRKAAAVRKRTQG